MAEWTKPWMFQKKKNFVLKYFTSGEKNKGEIDICWGIFCEIWKEQGYGILLWTISSMS